MMKTNQNYKETLLSLFSESAITEKQIDDAIETVLDNHSSDSTCEEHLEIMIELLMESGDSCLKKNRLSIKAEAIDLNEAIIFADDEDDKDEEDEEDDEDNNFEGAVGFSNNVYKEISEKDFNTLLHMFVDICPTYLTEFCRLHHQLDLYDIIGELSQTAYVKQVKDPLVIWNDLKQMLPNADPIYLRNQARVLAEKSSHDLETFLENAVANNDYPSMQDYLKKEEQLDEVAVYTKNFTVNRYLERIPNPTQLFSERKPILSGNKIEKNDEDFALNFLYNQFNYLRQNDIKKIFLSHNKHLTRTSNVLKFLPRAFRNPRKLIKQEECLNISLLQEVAFLKHEKQIRQFLKMQNDKYCQALEEARKYGLLRTCGCCFDDELIPEECLFCDKDCTFCKQCVKLGAENCIGEGKIRFPCLADCNSEFSYLTLKMVLDKKVFQRLCQRKQIEEIKNANIDGLETCPFCDFSMIPAEGDKIFKCENIECMKESCRECRHISHIPLKCSEIEYDEDVKMRVFIENKMTAALLRECWKCKKSFYKESGCNKMTCLCGAKMCYICGKSIKNYQHFGTGGCPLYTENLQQFHLNRVIEGAQSAKRELGITENPNKLKFDPTRTLGNNVK